MRTILCFGDSNLRGFIPGSFDETIGLSRRFSKNKRWTGLLQEKLGNQYHIIEEGMNGRTTNLDELTPGRPFRNGLTYLPFCLESHYPIDLVILQLGTNDVKNQYNRSPRDIAEGLRDLIKMIKTSKKGPAFSAPKIFIIAPQPLKEIPGLEPEYSGEAIFKSEALADLYRQLAHEENCEFLDAGQLFSSSEIDGVHLDENASQLLAEAVASKIKLRSSDHVYLS